MQSLIMITIRSTDSQPNSNNANGITKNAAIVVPLKYLTNFWWSLEMPLVNCKVELKIKSTKHCFVCSW